MEKFVARNDNSPFSMDYLRLGPIGPQPERSPEEERSHEKECNALPERRCRAIKTGICMQLLDLRLQLWISSYFSRIVG
jgi:hypothetical protein